MKICDLHNDFLTEINNLEDKKKYFEKSLLNNKLIRFVNCVIWTSKIKDVNLFIKNNNFILKERNNNKILISFEDLDFIIKNKIIDFDELKLILDIKPFSCGVVWNYDNNIGGGAFGKNGLSTNGKNLVGVLESNNILIDTAHMNRRTFYDFVKISKMPIYNSHSNIYQFKKHRRNLTDKQIKIIINSNGFIGLSFVCDFISDKKVDCDIIVQQIKFFTDRYGCNNIGIGSDFFGTDNLPVDVKDYFDLRKLRKKMLEQGFSKWQVNKIFYKNFINFKNRLKVYA